MTLYEALEDQGRGRFIDTGCDYQMIALAKGTYKFYFWHPGKTTDGTVEITLTGKQGENAREIERQFYKACEENALYHNEIIGMEYRKH